MSAFPKTSLTLIAKIRDLPPGKDDAAWTRFWNLYTPVMHRFAAKRAGEQYAEDLMMAVLGKLVTVLRNGQYDPKKGPFHSYVATMIANEAYMQHRKDVVRKADMHVSFVERVVAHEMRTHLAPGGEKNLLQETVEVVPATDDAGVATNPDAPDKLDDDWQRAVMETAVAHVLDNTAISERDRRIWELYKQEKTVPEIAAECRTTRNNVSQVISRLVKRIAAYAKTLLDGRTAI